MTGSAKKTKEKTTQEFERAEEQRRLEASRQVSQQLTSDITSGRVSDVGRVSDIGRATTTQRGVTGVEQTIDPTARLGLEGLISQAQGLEGAPLAPGLSPETLAAIGAVGGGISGIDEQALGVLRSAAAGEFVPGDTGALERVSGFVGERAERQVSDLFTAGGRSGSRASQRAVGEGVARAISPFAFEFERGEAQRRDAANAQRIGAALGIQEITSQSDVFNLQAQLSQLEAAGRIDAAQREKLEEPFRRLGIISGVVTGAAAGLPTGQVTTADITGVTEEERLRQEDRLREEEAARTGLIFGDITRIGTGETAGTATGTSGGTRTGTEFGVSIPFI